MLKNPPKNTQGFKFETNPNSGRRNSMKKIEIENQDNTSGMKSFLNYFTGLFFGHRDYKNWQIALFLMVLVGIFAFLTSL